MLHWRGGGRGGGKGVGFAALLVLPSPHATFCLCGGADEGSKGLWKTKTEGKALLLRPCPERPAQRLPGPRTSRTAARAS